MTFLSFNVNSIKAYLGKDLLSQWLPLSPDFISIEEFSTTCNKLSKTHIEQLKALGAFAGMADTSQVTLF